MYASEMVGRVADRAVQIHGGAGYFADYGIERFYRDVRLFRIYEGTIQQLVIARGMIKAAGAASGNLRRITSTIPRSITISFSTILSKKAPRPRRPDLQSARFANQGSGRGVLVQTSSDGEELQAGAVCNRAPDATGGKQHDEDTDQPQSKQIG